jgi:phosphatidylcholine synthase
LPLVVIQSGKIALDSPTPQKLEEVIFTAKPRPTVSRMQQWAALVVHLYTASGVVFVFLALQELFVESPNPAKSFFWLLVAVLIDATDGPLARQFHVKSRAPNISGRTIDDIVDYLSFTFVPLVLIWRMNWLPGGADWSWTWLIPAMVSSLFGFANTDAKHEDEGFFSGFPSYWNVVAFYCGIWYELAGAIPVAALLCLLSVATVVPIRFLYPNLTPYPWRTPVLGGALLWSLLMLVMLWHYPRPPVAVYWLSLLYPLAYFVLSIVLDIKTRRSRIGQKR